MTRIKVVYDINNYFIKLYSHIVQLHLLDRNQVSSQDLIIRFIMLASLVVSNQTTSTTEHSPRPAHAGGHVSALRGRHTMPKTLLCTPNN